MIQIDGSRGEGGGQVLRSALSLSAWLGRPFRITSIRARRRQPGLKAQHLAAVKMVSSICGASVVGATKGSQMLEFSPGPVRAGSFEQEVGTAGATTLVAQAAALPLLSAPGHSRLRIGGGTHVAWSPPVDYLCHVYAPFLKLLGLHLRVKLLSYGFYPRGGGRVEVAVEGRAMDESRLHGLPLENQAPERGSPEQPAPAVVPQRLVLERPPRNRIRIEATAVVSSLPRSIAERMIRTVVRALSARHWRVRERIAEEDGPTGTYVFVRVYSQDAPDPGGGCSITGGFTGLGAIKKPAERVAEEAVAEALAFLDSNACLDSRLADQLLLPAAMAGVALSFKTNRITSHLRTHAETIAHFLGPSVRIEESGQVTVEPRLGPA